MPLTFQEITEADAVERRAVEPVRLILSHRRPSPVRVFLRRLVGR
jgi:hypothetical protein